MSIVYLGVAALVGIACWAVRRPCPSIRALSSEHAGLGCHEDLRRGYHILPKFMGRQIYSKKLGEAEFWIANIGLVAMLVFYTLNVYRPSDTLVAATVLAGALEMVLDPAVLLQHAEDPHAAGRTAG